MLLGSLAMIAACTSSAPAQVSTRARLTSLPLQSVQINDPFWSPKYETWRNVTIKDCLEKFEHDGTLANFDRIAAGDLTTKHAGAPWFDGLLYEMIHASADFMAVKPDPALKARLDSYIDRIAAAAAKDPDGYINTYTTVAEPTHRWGQNGGNDRWQHDLYNNGCLIEAAIHYYRATGETKLLASAVRAANGMVKVMGPAPRQNIIPGHAIPEEAMVCLYQLFQAEPALKDRLGIPVAESDYLALAKFWFDIRGNHAGRTDYGAYNQDAAPALAQTTIEGHAVRAALFASGMVAFGLAADQPDYVNVASGLWKNMTTRRMYITGGIGSFADDEKFGPDYVLPNDGYLETCAAVANCFFSHNLALANGDASAYDVLERSLYNNALAGVSLAGNSYFYENPLHATPKRQRWSWHGCPCCPPMFLKLMGALPSYIFSTDNSSSLYVNLFIGSKATLNLANTPVTLTQTTTYPNSGDITLSIDPAAPATFDVLVRIPAWTQPGPTLGDLYSLQPTTANAVTLSVNGAPVASPDIAHGYAKLHREWRPGDKVQISFAMPITRITANPAVEADRNKVALSRGPLIYCLESPDNPNLDSLFLSDTAAITTQPSPDLLGGVITLTAPAELLHPNGTTSPATLRAIPYYTNANRGPVTMQTWLPRTAEAAKPAALKP